MNRSRTLCSRLRQGMTKLHLERLADRVAPHTGGVAGGLIADGHFDIFEASIEDGELEVNVVNHETGMPFKPEGSFLIAQPQAKQTRPTGSKFDFLGVAEGKEVWILPQTQIQGLLFGGVAAEDIEPGTLGSYFETDPRINSEGEHITFTIKSFSGPGSFSVWANDPFGQPIVYVDTADGVTAEDKLFGKSGLHDDYNFGFTAPGEYKFVVQANAFKGPGATNPIRSDEETYTFFVRQTADELPPSFVPPTTPPPVVTPPVSVVPPKPTAPTVIVAGVDVGGQPTVKVFDAKSGQESSSFAAFDSSFSGGVRVASADVNQDGVMDIIAASGPGGQPLVRVFDGKTKLQISEFQAFESTFTGGVFVATGDVNGDGVADIVVSADQGGGPRIRVFDGKNTANVLADFFGIEDTNFRGGARVSTGDINGDGRVDLLVGAGFGGGPRIAGFDGRTMQKLFSDFFVFEQTLRDGVFVASGDVNGDKNADLIFGGGPGGGPRVFVLSGKDALANQQTQLANFFAGDPNSRGGVRVSAIDTNGDSISDIVTGSGANGTVVTTFDGKGMPTNGTPPKLNDLNAFGGMTNGLFVG